MHFDTLPKRPACFARDSVDADSGRSCKTCFNGLTGAAMSFKVYAPAMSVLVAAMALGQWLSAAEVPPPESQKREPHPIEPPHKPVQRGTQVGVILGLDFLTYSRYGYNTAVTLPDGNVLNYAGKQTSTGGTFFVGAAVTPPRALRRLTAGVTLNVGGVESWAHSVIPSGTPTPFSQRNLNSEVQRRLVYGYPWRPSVSPYIEHELGSVLENRIRIGYQYSYQTGSYQGSFAADDTGTATAQYHIRFSNSSHLVRVSLNSRTSLDDSDENPDAARRRFAFVQQAGLLAGTNRTITLFLSFGPSWSF